MELNNYLFKKPNNLLFKSEATLTASQLYKKFLMLLLVMVVGVSGAWAQVEHEITGFNTDIENGQIDFSSSDYYSSLKVGDKIKVRGKAKSEYYHYLAIEYYENYNFKVLETLNFNTDETTILFDVTADNIENLKKSARLQCNNVILSYLALVESSSNSYKVTFEGLYGGGTVSATVGGNSITSGASVPEGTQVTFTATPSNDNYCWKWNVNSTAFYNYSNTRVETVSGNLEVTHQFGQVNVHAHTNDANMGTVNAVCGENSGTDLHLAPYPGDVVFTATPKSGYKFSGWYSDEARNTLVSNDNPYTVNNPENPYNLYAKFEAVEDGKIVTFSANDGNLGSVSATVNGNPINSGDVVEAGTQVTFTATPSGTNLHWGWDGTDGRKYDGNKTVTINSDYNIVAQFHAGIHIRAYANNSSLGSVNIRKNSNNSTDYHVTPWPGEFVFVATPNENVNFLGWYTSADCSGEPESTEAEYTKTGITNQDITLYAKFEAGVTRYVAPTITVVGNKLTITQPEGQGTVFYKFSRLKYQDIANSEDRFDGSFTGTTSGEITLPIAEYPIGWIQALSVDMENPTGEGSRTSAVAKNTQAYYVRDAQPTISMAGTNRVQIQIPAGTNGVYNYIKYKIGDADTWHEVHSTTTRTLEITSAAVVYAQTWSSYTFADSEGEHSGYLGSASTEFTPTYTAPTQLTATVTPQNLYSTVGESDHYGYLRTAVKNGNADFTDYTKTYTSSDTNIASIATSNTAANATDNIQIGNTVGNATITANIVPIESSIYSIAAAPTMTAHVEAKPGDWTAITSYYKWQSPTNLGSYWRYYMGADSKSYAQIENSVVYGTGTNTKFGQFAVKINVSKKSWIKVTSNKPNSTADRAIAIATSSNKSAGDFQKKTPDNNLSQFVVTNAGEYYIGGVNNSDNEPSDMHLKTIEVVPYSDAPALTVDDANDRTFGMTNYNENYSYYYTTDGSEPTLDGYTPAPNALKLEWGTKIQNGHYDYIKMFGLANNGTGVTEIATLSDVTVEHGIEPLTVISVKIAGTEIVGTLNQETKTFVSGKNYYGNPSIVVTLSDGTVINNEAVTKDNKNDISQLSTASFVVGAQTYYVSYNQVNVGNHELTALPTNEATTWIFAELTRPASIIETWTWKNMTMFASEANPMEVGGNNTSMIGNLSAGSQRVRSFAIKVGGKGTLTITGNVNGPRKMVVVDYNGNIVGEISMTKTSNTNTDYSFKYSGNSGDILYFYVSSNDVYRIDKITWTPYCYFDKVFDPKTFENDETIKAAFTKTDSKGNKTYGGQKNSSNVTVDEFFTITKECDMSSVNNAKYNLYDGRERAAGKGWVFNFGGAGCDSWNWNDSKYEEKYRNGRRSVEFTPGKDGQLHVYVHSTAYVPNGNDVAVRSLILRDNSEENRGAQTKFTGQTGNFMSMLNCAKADENGTITEVIYNCKAGRRYSLASCSSGLYIYYMGYHNGNDDEYTFSDPATIEAPEVSSTYISATTRRVFVTQKPETSSSYKYTTRVNVRNQKSQVECPQGGFYPSSSDAKAAWIAAHGQSAYDALGTEEKAALDKGFDEAGAAGKQKPWYSIGSPTAENEEYDPNDANLNFEITDDIYIRCVTINETNNELAKAKLESSSAVSPIYDSKFVDYMIFSAPTISPLIVNHGESPLKSSNLEATKKITDTNYSAYTKKISYLVVPLIQNGVPTGKSEYLSAYVNEGTQTVNGVAFVGGVTSFVKADGWVTEGDKNGTKEGIQIPVDLDDYSGGDKLMIIAVSVLDDNSGTKIYSFATSRIITIEALKTPTITVNGGQTITASTPHPVYSTIATNYEGVEPADGVVDTKNNVRAFYTTDGTDPVVVKDGDNFIAGNSSTTMYDPGDVSNTQPKLSQTGLIKAMNVNTSTGETSKVVAANVMLVYPNDAGVAIIPDVQVIHFQNGKVNKDAKFNDYAQNDAAQTGSLSGQTNLLNNTFGYDRSSKATFLFYENIGGVTSARATISDKRQTSVDNETFAHAETSQNVLAFQAYEGSLVKIVASGTVGYPVSLGYADGGNGSWVQVGQFAVQGDDPATFYVRIPTNATPGDKKAFYIRRDNPNTNIYYVGVYSTEGMNWNQWTFSSKMLSGNWNDNDAVATSTGSWAYNVSLPPHSTFEIVSAIDEPNANVQLDSYKYPTLEKGQGVLIRTVAPKGDYNKTNKTNASTSYPYYINETLVRDVKHMVNVNEGGASASVQNYLRPIIESAVTADESRQYMVWSYGAYRVNKDNQYCDEFGNTQDVNGNPYTAQTADRITQQAFYFYKKGNTVGKNKAYIKLSKPYPLGTGQNGISVVHLAPIYGGTFIYDDNTDNDDEPTIIETVDDNSVKEVNTSIKGIYTLSGQRISEITKTGIYIVNGKKMMIKK